MSNAPSEFRYDVCLSFAGKDPMPQGSRCNLVRRVKTNTFVTDFDSPRTTKLYDRRREQVAQDEVERIRF